MVMVIQYQPIPDSLVWSVIPHCGKVGDPKNTCLVVLLHLYTMAHLYFALYFDENHQNDL